jgi:hypothetical protein
MFIDSEKGLNKTPKGYFSQLIQTRSKSINEVSSEVSFRFQSNLERQHSMLILGVPRVRKTMMVHQMNEAQYHNHDRTNEDSRAYSHYIQHGHQNATRIYLRYPCKGRLYHLITTLLEKK